MRTRLVVAAFALLLTVTFALAPARVAAAPQLATQGDEGVTTTEAPDSPSIIPKPDSGSEPVDAGDRGGALQSILFVVVIGGIVLIGAFIVRESRRSRAERGF